MISKEMTRIVFVFGIFSFKLTESRNPSLGHVKVEPNLHFWLFKNATEHHVKSNKCSEETYTIFMILVLHQVIPSYTKVEPS